MKKIKIETEYEGKMLQKFETDNEDVLNFILLDKEK